MSTYVCYSSGGPDLLPLPYLSVTKHLLTPRRNHFQWSCSSQSRINCSNSNQYVSVPSWQGTNVHSFTLPVSRLFCLLWRCFCSLCADCSCVPVLLPDLLYPSFTPRHLPISMQPREYTEYKYTTVTLYNISKGTLHNQKVQTTMCTGFTTNGSCSCTRYLSTARSCGMTIQITRVFLFLYFFHLKQMRAVWVSCTGSILSTRAG